MSDVYSHAPADDKAAHRESKVKMQKKQMELVDEDEKLKRMERSLQEAKHARDDLKRKAEKYQVELLNIEREASDLEKKQSDAEHEIALQRARIRKLEHEVETLREETYRGTSGSHA